MKYGILHLAENDCVEIGADNSNYFWRCATMLSGQTCLRLRKTVFEDVFEPYKMVSLL